MNISYLDSLVDNFNTHIQNGNSEEVEEWAREGRKGSAVFGALSVAIAVGSAYLFYRYEDKTPRVLKVVPTALCSCIAYEMARLFRFSTAVFEAAVEKKPLDEARLRSEVDATIIFRYLSNRIE
jgi:hypothetical protein